MGLWELARNEADSLLLFKIPIFESRYVAFLKREPEIICGSVHKQTKRPYYFFPNACVVLCIDTLSSYPRIFYALIHGEHVLYSFTSRLSCADIGAIY